MHIKNITTSLGISLVTHLTLFGSVAVAGLVCEPQTLMFSGNVRSPLEAQSLTVSNNSPDLISYAIKSDAFFVTADAANGLLAPGEARLHVVRIGTLGLAPRSYTAALTLEPDSGPSATIPVTVTLARTEPPTQVLAWGWNGLGATSVPAGLTDVVAVASSPHNLALRANGTVAAWGHGEVYPEFTVPSYVTNIVAVSAGNGHSLALRSDGTLLAWGMNNYGQSTVPDGLGVVVAAAAGALYSLALRSNRYVSGWGSSASGAANIPAYVSNVVSIAAGYYDAVALRGDGTVVQWGSGLIPWPPAGLSNVVAVSAGIFHAMALKKDGTIVCWGSANDHGASYYMPSGLSNVVAISAGGYHSFALKADGTSASWGWNERGQCNTPTALLSPLAIPSMGWYHSIALQHGTFLTVSSAFGAPVPSVGTYEMARGGCVTGSVESVIGISSHTQRVCKGWTGTGSVPSSGSGTSTGPINVYLPSSLKWQWGMQFMLSTGVTGEGSLADPGGWKDEDSSVTLNAVPAPGWLLTGWTGDVVSVTNTAITVSMDRTKAISAIFSDDADGDSLKNEDEYTSGSNPWSKDSDNDGFDDGYEVAQGWNPVTPDTHVLDYIRQHQRETGLYTEDSMQQATLGNLHVKVENGRVILVIQVEESDDLVSWRNVGEPLNMSIPATTNKMFYKVGARQQ